MTPVECASETPQMTSDFPRVFRYHSGRGFQGIRQLLPCKSIATAGGFLRYSPITLTLFQRTANLHVCGELSRLPICPPGNRTPATDAESQLLASAPTVPHRPARNAGSDSPMCARCRAKKEMRMQSPPRTDVIKHLGTFL